MPVVKRAGEKQKFDERKVYASCYNACLNCEMPKKEAEKICEKVTDEVKKWVAKQKTVDSNEIFTKIIEALKKLKQGDAAFMYETHRDLS